MANPPGILVTGTSSNHFSQLHGLVASAQRHLPDTWRIVVYDLLGDLAPKDKRRLAGWCGVEYRIFDAQRVHNSTWFPRYLTLSVWKPSIIRDCLRELPAGGLVVYADTSIRLHEPLGPALIFAVQEHGFVGRQTASPIAMYTHPGMAFELARDRAARTGGDSVVAAANISEYSTAPMVCGCLLLWANTRFVLEQLLAPWESCTNRRSCILPVGADGQDNHIGLSTRCKPGLSGHCHRGDQSALSIILYEAFDVRARGVAAYLQNTTVGKETWRMGKSWLYGTLFTTERASNSYVEPLAALGRGGARVCTRMGAGAHTIRP
jgi:hypothetical protein